MAIQNRYEFMYYVACTNCNPNGDPDMGNMPRLDPQTMQGFITDAATKRRIRNYVELAHQGEPGMNIIIQQATNINRHIAEAKRAAGVEDCAKAKEAVYAGRKKACELFYDVRTFGAVMSTGPNAGQVRGQTSTRAQHTKQHGSLPDISRAARCWSVRIPTVNTSTRTASSTASILKPVKKYIWRMSRFRSCAFATTRSVKNWDCRNSREMSSGSRVECPTRNTTRRTGVKAGSSS